MRKILSFIALHFITLGFFVATAHADVLPLQSVTVESVTNNTATVSWVPAPSSTESAYQVMQSNDGIQFTSSTGGTVVPPATATTVTGLNPDTQYYFSVIAADSTTTQQMSASSSIYTLPNNPVNISVGTTTPTTAIVHFNANGNPATVQYAILLSPVGGAPFWVTPTSSTSTAAVYAPLSSWILPLQITNLLPNTTYGVSAYAVNSLGQNSLAPATTLFSTPNISVSLSVDAISVTALNLTVQSAATSSALYQVADQRVDNGSIVTYYLKSDATFSTTTSYLTYSDINNGSAFTVANLLPNSRHVLRAYIFTSSTSAAGQTVSKFTLASQPSQVTVVTSSLNSISFSWVGDATQYQVSLPGDKVYYDYQVSSLFSLNSPTCNATYNFYIQGLNGDGVQTAVTPVVISTPGCPVQSTGGGGGGGGGGGFSAPTIDGIITIPATTQTQIVLFSVSSTSASDIMFSESSSFVGATWQPVSTTNFILTLSPGTGMKTVYAKFRSNTGLESVLHTLNIYYQPVTSDSKVVSAVLGVKISSVDDLIKITKYGEKSSNVIALQQMLMQLGYLPAKFKPVTQYGPATKNAVAAYQKAQAAKIAKAASIAAVKTYLSVVTFGTTTPMVKKLQSELQKLGYLSKTFKVSSYFGSATNQAVNKFLASNK